MNADIRDIMVQIKKEGGFFRLFSDKEIDLTSTFFKILEYPAGSVASKPDEPLDLMGIVISGEVIFEEKTEMKGKWIVQARLTRGSILAHPSMFGVKPPPVRVLMSRDSAFLAIDKLTFESFLKKHPEIGVKFLQEMIRVLYIRLRSYAARFTSFS
jgi:CRP-like cAMP-binding protein